MEVLGRSIPNADSNACRPRAITTPAASPITEANTPTSAASVRTDARTWPRLAPSARRSASSRVRWAVMIENVLKMMNAPTNSAMNAKTRRAVLKNPSPSLSASVFSSATALAVTASTPSGSTCSIRRDAILRDHVDRIEDAHLAEGLLRGRQVEHREGRPGEVVGLAESDDRADRELLRRPLEEDLDRLPDPQVVALGGARVDGDLPEPFGRRALADLDHRRIGIPARADRRGPEPTDRLVRHRIDELRVTGHVAVSDVDALDLEDVLEDGVLDRFPALGAATAGATGRRREGRLRADDHVGVRRCVLEQVVEGSIHRVGEDVGARHEAHAEHHRERGEHEPHLLREEALERRPPHGQLSSDFRRSRTRSAVGSSISSTTRPSARNTIRSAWLAAFASWVTMTIVCP